MDAQTQARIFEPFFTTKKTGSSTGFGLSSVFGIVQNHHGFITVRSGKGRGTTFPGIPAGIRTAHPRAERRRPLPRRRPRGARNAAAGGGRRDGRDHCRPDADPDRPQGLPRRAAATEAVSIYQEQREKIELVILDMIMPGMSGAETFEKLKAIDPGGQRVLLSSGYSLNGQAAEILNRGCRGFIQKPFTIEQLSQKIRDVLSSSEQTSD
jgi:two-component system, cell cycle sensor histidine kinase and response regulator CckA